MEKPVRKTLEAMCKPLILEHLEDGCNIQYIDIQDLDTWIEKSKERITW
jgi:hypothetical protein